MVIYKNEELIESLEDWKRLAPPKSAQQWVDGRSAKESARAWLEGGGEYLPSDLEILLRDHQAFGPVLHWKAEPEAKLRFDSFRGEPRNSDLAAHVEDSHGKFLIAVEAKADETFGEKVSDALGSALERYAANAASNGIARIQQLAIALFKKRKRGQIALKDVRYQLLTASAAALCEAEGYGYTRSLLLIQEFVTDKTLDKKHERNAKDLNRFLARLSDGEYSSLASGEIVGPIRLPGTPLVSANVELYLGKLSRNVRAN
ncbi:DUF6946 family protein [Lentisalinibacter sediminis]|uniref:DUF6946 family protein n=1 Tax=Lentisalinibacter sediminis TaxID=2992237 RepID=UPI00386FFE53